MATTNGSTAIRDKILASLAHYRALRIGKFPCAFWRLSSRPGLTAAAMEAGFTDSAHFNHCFQNIFGVSPLIGF
ncbi:helix-turn-helix domain-containing protein [Bathymodiolus japonicus methanotrophic gill symbiont]|uniref:helix-turn-helix domain-containing protein n=1 Tax=Bathymodiolus japonicus methanotrophic gill symbiont TaxID=113269 RepID=UPI001C8DF280|nr:helix-turn-helix domain-containing protein [Bathymodiolus japonicus methanotrophic gill symbiont]